MAITKEILDELLKDPSVPISGSVANKPDIRSSMLVDWPNSIITGGCSDQIQSVQMATLSIRDHPSLCSLVFTLRPQLSRPRRNDERTRSVSRSHDDLPLVSGICSGTGEKNSPSLESDERLLPRR